jgi:alkylated DNA nucleotide flippase Atl1
MRNSPLPGMGYAAMAHKKSWREKLADDQGLPRVEPINEKMARRFGTGTVVIPASREVDALMRAVPRGKLTTIRHIASALAEKHHASIGCPITTGIFAWIAAHAAGEEEAGGRKRVTPYWRTLKNDGELNPKYPGGIEGQRFRLEAEGHTVVQKGKRFVVADVDAHAITPKLS